MLEKQISAENIYKNMSYLVNEVGERLSGTAEMRKATEYINNQLRSYGIDSHIDHFPMYQSYPGESELRVISPESREIKCRPVCHIDSTPEEGIEGELIYLGTGAYEDYEGISVKDKIVLTDMNWSPGRPEKARIAWEMGAKALIIMNWGKADSDLIQMGGVKAQWGNPTPDTEKEIVRLTVISISRRDGEYLTELCKKDHVKVWLRGEATRSWITADQPIGRVYGGKSNGDYVLVGSHVDAWGKSAICNSAGNAVNLEIARLCQENREALNKDVVFTFWDGHEIAEGGGSTWYCDHYWKDLTNHCIAYINIDNLAIKGTTVPGVESQPELKKFLMSAIRKIWGVDGVWHHAYKGGGDSSFFGVGVPYIAFATEYTEEKLRELNYAFYSPWLHSDADTIDKIDRDLLMKHIDYFIYILEYFINSGTIPYDLRALREDIMKQWDELYAKSGKAAFLIEDLDESFEKYSESLKWLEEQDPQKCPGAIKAGLYNKVIKMCERQTAVFRCESGRYGQDSCCALHTEKPIPALSRAIEKYNAAVERSHEFYLWETQILRVKNMVFDALNSPVQYINILRDEI